MRILDINPPPTEPISLETAKTFLRIDHNHEDGLITDFIRSAREHVEVQICASLIARDQRLERDLPRGKVIYLNRYPVSDIAEIRVITQDEAIILPVSDYDANLKARPVPITLSSQKDWCAAYPGATSIEIDFTAGFGLSEDDVPMPIRQAMLLLIAQSYEYRGDDGVPSPMMVDALLMPYKGMRL